MSQPRASRIPRATFPPELMMSLAKRKEVRLLRIHNSLVAGRITKSRAIERGFQVLEEMQEKEIAEVRRWARRSDFSTDFTVDDPVQVKGLVEDKEVWKQIVDDL